MKPKKPATKTATPVGPATDAGPITIAEEKDRALLGRHAPLAEAIALYNGFIRNGLEKAFPPVLQPAVVRAKLLGHLAVLRAREAASAHLRVVVDHDMASTQSATEVLDRLEEIVDGTYDHGEPGRKSFFPETPDRPEGERLAAMVHGIETVGLDLPAEFITLPALKALAARAADDDTARVEAEKAHADKSTAGKNLAGETRAIRRRLAKIVRGRLGRYNPAQADFGLKVPKKPVGRRRRPKPAADGSAPATKREPKKKHGRAAKQDKAAAGGDEKPKDPTGSPPG